MPFLRGRKASGEDRAERGLLFLLELPVVLVQRGSLPRVPQGQDQAASGPDDLLRGVRPGWSGVPELPEGALRQAGGALRALLRLQPVQSRPELLLPHGEDRVRMRAEAGLGVRAFAAEHWDWRRAPR